MKNKNYHTTFDKGALDTARATIASVDEELYLYVESLLFTPVRRSLFVWFVIACKLIRATGEDDEQ